ncbi:hypothetical protein DIPPA_34733 [Diplonema papillatum]|nr:hypothetical protein DIPPA_34733 [Diplonema papillatum]|eukprot:gene3307-5185_t
MSSNENKPEETCDADAILDASTATVEASAAVEQEAPAKVEETDPDAILEESLSQRKKAEPSADDDAEDILDAILDKMPSAQGIGFDSTVKSHNASVGSLDTGSPIMTENRPKARVRIADLPSAEAPKQQPKPAKKESKPIFGVRFCERIARLSAYSFIGAFILTRGRFAM